MEDGITFPSSAASSLVSGYCDDFVALAATMAQTLEQVAMRNLPLGDNRRSLDRVEKGMRELADAIRSMLTRPDGQLVDPLLAAKGSAVGANGSAVSQATTRAADVSRTLATGDDGHRPKSEDKVRVSGAGGRPAKRPGAVIFQGDTDSIPVRSVMQYLSRMRETGTLWIALGEERITIDLLDGCVAGTTSDRPPSTERVGDLLVETGLVSPDQIVEGHGSSNGPHGSVSVGVAMMRAGLITERQLLEVLELQVRRRVERANKSRHAAYSFHEATRSRGHGRLRIRPFELLGRPEVSSEPAC